MRAFVVVLAACVAAPALAQNDDPAIARGRYVSQIGGCNDCHTPGYGPSGGKIPEAQRLTGDALGWHGPWGTTYPTNLRLYFQDLTEGEWLAKAKTLSARPPMPWFNVRAMTDDDLRALYRYVRHLGPAGKPAPAYLPPDRKPPAPVVEFPAPPKH
jgi:mono/diheme cytochrome c family protein